MNNHHSKIHDKGKGCREEHPRAATEHRQRTQQKIEGERKRLINANISRFAVIKNRGSKRTRRANEEKHQRKTCRQNRKTAPSRAATRQNMHERNEWIRIGKIKKGNCCEFKNNARTTHFALLLRHTSRGAARARTGQPGRDEPNIQRGRGVVTNVFQKTSQKVFQKGSQQACQKACQKAVQNSKKKRKNVKKK